MDIRRPGAYERWHSRGGLRCVSCGEPVHPFLRGDRVWLRHNAADAEHRHRSTGAGGRESEEHVALTWWIHDWLEAQSLSPKYNRTAAELRPDVQVEVPGRKVAYEVQLSAIPLHAARLRTELLQHHGYEVLWVTRNVDWVDQLPAVGLRAETEQPDRYRTTEVHGLHYSVMEGYLSLDRRTGRLQPGARRPALATFLRDHLAQTLDWGPVQQNSDGMQNGWASMDDWKRHTEWQARRIAELETMLHEVADARSGLQRQLGALDAAARGRQRDLVEAQEQLDQRTSELDRERGYVAEAEQRCLAAGRTAAQWRHAYEALRGELSSTAFRRWKFRALLKPPE
ncbi:competence protein CoiA family protein [Modestobacter lacusdianchii]